MIKKIYISLLFFSLILSLRAQQIGIYSHEFYKPMISNPAFTGNDESINAMLISRSQWIDFKNAPQLNIFTLDGMLTNKKMGIGLDLFSDKKGISNKIGGNIYYSYWLKINDNSKLKFGIALGIIDHTLHYSEAIVEDPSDPFITGTSQRETSINGNVGLGFVWKKLDVGVSVPQLLGNTLEYQDNTSGKSYYSPARHYQGSLKYKFLISENRQISLTPLTMVHFLPNTPIQYDVNLNLEWKDKFWIGATYKSDYAVSANAGVCIKKKFYVGYSYDFIIGNIGKYSGMSHELMLNFVFGKTKQNNEPVAEVSVLPSKDKEKADSLQTELEIKENKIIAGQERINDLNKELANLKTENESLKKEPIQTKDSIQINSNQNSATIAENLNKTMENGVWVITNKASEFKDSNNHLPQKGFYVIVGAFVYKDFAKDEVKRFIDKGYKATDWVYCEPKFYHYVFVAMESTKEAALKTINEVRSAGVKDAWILSIKE